MLLRPYGRTGLQVPALGFGAMQLGDPQIAEDHAGRMLNEVLDAGLTLIDTARSYGLSEERIGRHLAHRRGEFVLSTKVGYGIPGIPDWTYDCVRAGVDAARDRMRTDVIDIVHLHSCPLATLQAGDVTRALRDCVAAGKVRVAAYSGDDAPLRHAAAGDDFMGLQASVNVCDQDGLPTLRAAQAAGKGTIAKRSLAGRPWASATAPDDAAHGEYHRRFRQLRVALGVEPDDWDALALRFTAYEPGVASVIVGGTHGANVRHNAASVAAGPLEESMRTALRAAFAALGADWRGIV